MCNLRVREWSVECVIERELRCKVEGELRLGENERFLFLSNNEG